MQDVKQSLSRFARHVVSQSKRNLTRTKKNAGKGLHQSIGYDLDVYKQSFHLSFTMEEYGKFVDQGVSGKQKKYNTDFSFKTKMPPSKPIDKWIKQRGIKGRGTDGRFITTKSLSFLIRRSIFNKGIKPSLFFTKPFEAAFKNLPNEVVESFGLEVDELLNKALNIK